MQAMQAMQADAPVPSPAREGGGERKQKTHYMWYRGDATGNALVKGRFSHSHSCGTSRRRFLRFSSGTGRHGTGCFRLVRALRGAVASPPAEIYFRNVAAGPMPPFYRSLPVRVNISRRGAPLLLAAWQRSEEAASFERRDRTIMGSSFCNACHGKVG